MRELKFFTEDEFKTMEAFASLIVPPGDNPQKDPGAKEVGSAEFIDSFLAERNRFFQEDFLNALKHLNKKASKLGKNFSNLTPESQKKIIEAFSKENEAQFHILRKITMYSFYCNYVKEAYEGPTPWELIGYLGPMTYSQMTTEMINRHYEDTQKDKTFTL